MKNKGFIFLGVALAAGYWLFESAVHAYVFHTGSFTESILPTDANEVWMRMMIMGMFLGFGIFAQFSLNRRIQMEEALRHSEKLLSNAKAGLAEAQRITHLGSWSRDIINDVLVWSDEHYRLFGLIPQEITPSFDVFLDFVHPDDRQRVRHAVDAALHESKPYNMDFRIMRQDGEAHILHSQAEVVFDEMNKPIAITGTAGDVTEIRQAQAVLRRERDQLEYSVVTEKAKLVRSNEALRKEIADRKQAEKGLRESEERFRQLAENICEVFWMTDLDKHTMLYVSSAYGRIWGRSRESLYRSPRDWIEAIHADDRERVRKAATAKQITGEYDEQYRVIRPDGSIRWIHDRAFPVRNDSGEVYRIAGIAEDITDNMQAKLLLQQSEKNYHNVFEFSHDAIFIIDPETHGFLNVNENAARRLGYSREELLRLTLEDIHRPEAATRTAAIIRDLEKTGGTLFEHVHRRKDGTEIPVEISAKLVTYNGRKAFQSSVRDITGRKQAEEALRVSESTMHSLIEATPDAIFFKDGAGRWLLTNKAAVDLFDLEGLDYHGKNDLELANLKPFYQQALTHCHESDAAAWQARTQSRAEEIIPQSGRPERVMDVVKVPLFHDDGRHLGLVIIGRDITERKQAELLEKQLMRELAHTSRLEEMGQMAAEIAHELHQPLSAIRTYSDTCLRMLKSGKEEPGKLVGVLGKIAGQAKRAGEVVHSVHDFSSKGKVCFLPQDVHDMVKEAIQLIQLETQYRGVQIKLMPANVLPPVLADRILIEQVLLNLMRNACEAMAQPQEEDRILTIQTRTADEEFVTVTVQDNGPGLSAQELEHLFDAFYTTKDSGMGLTLSSLIIDNHGGRIWAEAGPNGGTTFCFTLPIAGKVEW
ncbi:MAG: PAS domain S-box protein [Mariprofundaceae bacterium]|nr:PAS domain S-box protein [Mariprofundaceae bacterium]